MTDPRHEFLPYWLRTAAPSGANGGLLDSLTRLSDEPWNDPRPATFAPTPWGSMTPPNLFGLSPTFPSAPPPSSWDPSSPAFLWHSPFGANAGFPAPTAQPVLEPWNDPRLAIFAQTPWAPMTPPPNLFGLSPTFPPAPPPSSWDPSNPAFLWHPPFSANAGFPPPPVQPVVEPWNDPPSAIFAQTPWVPIKPPPEFVPPSAFPPALPLEHLDSGKYWPAAPAPSGANEQPPAHGFYFPPVPQAPSWDQVPTHPADSAAPSSSKPPSPSPWPMPAPPPKHLDSAKYWPVAPGRSGTNEQSPTHGFYLAPVPQAPSQGRGADVSGRYRGVPAAG